MANIQGLTTDTTYVVLQDSSMKVAKTSKTNQIIIIQDYKKPKDTPFYESPLLISIIFPFMVSVLTILIIKLLDRKKNKLEIGKIEQEITIAKQALKDEQIKLELANKNYLLEISKAQNDYNAQYNSLLEERKKYNLELFKYKEQQISELKSVLRKIQLILAKMENEFKLNQGSVISSDDHKEYQAKYFVENHQEINQELRSILSETFLFHSELSPFFNEAISSIIILMNRINSDREEGQNTDDPEYMWRHIEQTSTSIENINSIIKKIREIIEPIKSI